MTIVAVPRELRERKAAHGEACTRCGLCCIVSLCPLATHVFQRPKDPGPCPALRLDAEKKSSCGLVVDPALYAPMLAAAHGAENLSDAARLLINSGNGCDMLTNVETPNFAYLERMNWADNRNRRLGELAQRIWNVGGHR